MNLVFTLNTYATLMIEWAAVHLVVLTPGNTKAPFYLRAILNENPFFKTRFKEWAYAGFAVTYISATVCSITVDGFNGLAFLPIITFGILIISYLTYHKLN